MLITLFIVCVYLVALAAPCHLEPEYSLDDGLIEFLAIAHLFSTSILGLLCSRAGLSPDAKRRATNLVIAGVVMLVNVVLTVGFVLVTLRSPFHIVSTISLVLVAIGPAILAGTSYRKMSALQRELMRLVQHMPSQDATATDEISQALGAQHAHTSKAMWIGLAVSMGCMVLGVGCIVAGILNNESPLLLWPGLVLLVVSLLVTLITPLYLIARQASYVQDLVKTQSTLKRELHTLPTHGALSPSEPEHKGNLTLK